MKPVRRLFDAFDGLMTDRPAVMPKIWLTLAARLRGVELQDVLADPALAMSVIVNASRDVRSDGARLFLFPRRRTAWAGNRLVEMDDGGNRLGVIDLEGGLATRLDDAGGFHLEDPRCIAFHTSWTHQEPLVRSLPDIGRIRIPEKSFYVEAGYAGHIARLKSEVGDEIGLAGDCGSATLSFCVSFRGMMHALMDLIEAPALVHALMEKGTAYAIERGKFHIDAGVRILRLNDSTGNMSVISPEHWKAFVYPHFKTVCDELHRYGPGVKIYCHICGNALPILKPLVEAGIDCIGPLDPLGGFSVAEARAALGDQMVLMGGVSTLSFVRSSEEELEREAITCLRQGDRKGKFILASGCALPADSKRENIEGLARAAEIYAAKYWRENHVENPC